MEDVNSEETKGKANQTYCFVCMRKALEPICKEVECHFSHVYHTGASVM